MKHFFSIVFLLVAIVACSQLEAPIMLPEEAAPGSLYYEPDIILYNFH